jgi:low affinity Fe/Cu permease
MMVENGRAGAASRVRSHFNRKRPRARLGPVYCSASLQRVQRARKTDFELDKETSMHEKFRKFSQRTSEITGSSWAFLIAVAAIVIWLVTGPIFKFSDTWQLIINTGTTIITFLMVFLIQNTQNRDGKAMQLKLDELIRSNSEARNSLIDLESLTDSEIDELQNVFQQLQQSESTSVQEFCKALQDKLAEK